MGRRGEAKQFQVGEWYLAKRSGSEFWHRCRFDPKSRTTVRVSIGIRVDGEKSLEDAKRLLTEWWIGNTIKKERDTADILLVEVVLSYWLQHASKLASGKRIGYSLKHITQFFEGMSVKDACRAVQIEEFVKAMKANKFAPSYINNLLGIIKAAVTRAWRREEISACPYIALIDGKAKKPKGPPLKPEQVAELLRWANRNTLFMMMIMLGTGCRPQAAFQLTWEQIDWENDLINLNQEGREQTAKYRPIVKMPPSLRSFLWTHRKPSGLIISRANRQIRRWETAWRNCRTKAKIPAAQPYSLRHTVARWLRASGVPKWEIENQLGHSALSTTDIYAPHAPDYLELSCAAIEKLMQEIKACGMRNAA